MADLTKEKYTVDKFYDAKTCEEFNATDFFLARENNEAKFWEKYRIKSAEFDFRCAYCNERIRLRGGRSDENSKDYRTLHFAHFANLANDCEIKTYKNLTREQQLAKKFNGAKESELHKKIKKSVAFWLCQTKSVSQVEIERRITGASYLEWRKPDIQAIFKDRKVVFEIQLATTYVDVIVARQEFYALQEMNVVWILNDFDKDKERFTTKDIAYSNNANIFEFNEEAEKMSKQANELILKVHFLAPEIPTEIQKEINYEWRSEFVSLDDLTFETDTHIAYYFDYKGQREAAENNYKEFLAQELLLKQEKELQELLLERDNLKKEAKRLKKVKSFIEQRDVVYENLTNKFSTQNKDLNELMRTAAFKEDAFQDVKKSFTINEDETFDFYLMYNSKKRLQELNRQVKGEERDDSIRKEKEEIRKHFIRCKNRSRNSLLDDYLKNENLKDLKDFVSLGTIMNRPTIDEIKKALSELKEKLEKQITSYWYKIEDLKKNIKNYECNVKN